MKRTSTKILVCVLLVVMLFGCNRLEEQYKLNLTMEQKIDDYEFFWDFLYNGFPLIEVIERRGTDLEKIKKEYFEKLESIKSKNEYLHFYDDLCFSIQDGKGIGHLNVVPYYMYDLYYKDSYPAVDENGENQLIKNFYVDKGIQNLSDNYKEEMKEEFEGEHDTLFADTKILEENNIAYVRIDSFLNVDTAQETEYIKTLDNFFSETRNYKHLIIDVSRNGGGMITFWKWIVGVHLHKEITFYKYGLYNENKYTKPYLDNSFHNGSATIIDINSVPNVENANTKLHNKAYKTVSTIYPAYIKTEKPRDDRKIWVLISGRCYSATDVFAVFCKQTHWATLVGENTGGLGATLFPPVRIALPNSGLMILWDFTYGLNPDGTCRDEFGVAPDIYTAEGKTSLETCLDEIKKFDAGN